MLDSSSRQVGIQNDSLNWIIRTPLKFYFSNYNIFGTLSVNFLTSSTFF
jgi:hypothetical protein